MGTPSPWGVVEGKVMLVARSSWSGSEVLAHAYLRCTSAFMVREERAEDGCGTPFVWNLAVSPYIGHSLAMAP